MSDWLPMIVEVLALVRAGSMLLSSAVVDADVRLVVGVVRLHRGLRGADVALGGGILSLAALVEERGQGDRGEDADDQDDDQELDEREALLVLSALAKLVEHVGEPS